MHSKLALLLLMACAAIACQGPVIPLAAQKGSTIVIPLTGSNDTWNNELVGYGGTAQSDPQRGSMVFRLYDLADEDPEPGPELITRGTTRIMPAMSSALAFGVQQGLQQLGVEQLVSIVDIPTEAQDPSVALGEQGLMVFRRQGGVDQPFDTGYNGRSRSCRKSWT